MKKYINRYSLVIMLGAMSLTAISCSDKDSDKSIQESNHNITIRSVRFVNDDNVNDINTLASSKKKGNTETVSINDRLNAKESSDLAIQPGTSFDYTTELQSNALKDPESNLKASSKAAALKAADVPLNQNKKFRLIFIPDGATAPIYNEVLNAGQNPELTVAANKKYKWFAISINDANSAPNIDNSGTISGSDLANKDFMFASGELTTQADNNYLDILFLRQMAAIELNLNTRGLFGNITDNSTIAVGKGTGSSFTNIIQTGDFSIFNGTFSNLQDAAPVNGAQMTVVDSRWGNAEKLGRFYTANTASVAANNLRVRLNSLNITLDDNSTRTFAANSIVPISHSAALSLTKGTLSRTTVRLIESGVTVDGLVWARTNMIYDVNKLYGGSYQAGRSDAYRFRPNNNYARAIVNTEYWNFGTATPTGTDYATTDPCRRVYPEETWRLPQEQNNPKEMTRLSQNTNRSTSRTQFSDGYRHTYSWATSQAANSAYPDNRLVLSCYGYRDANGTVQQAPYASGNAAGTLRYRSNAFNTSNNYNYILYAEVSGGSFGETTIQQTPPNQGTVIRCVRNRVNN